MVGDDSVTFWLDGVKLGDDQATGKLWDRYFQRLVRVAARKLSRNQRRDVDEEDVALSAFHSFCERVGRGQFHGLAGRDELWRLLVVITTRKIVAIARNRACKKRGAGRVVGESALLESPDTGDEGLARFVGREPSPEFAAQLAEDYRRLMEALVDDTLRTIAVMRLEGHKVGEIARRLAISPRSIERKLHLIRQVWEQMAAGEPCGSVVRTGRSS
jgi:DNA-directed RNA polymerase specialized sigma24 family protein